MLNWIFLFLILGGAVIGALNGTMAAVSKASIDSSKTAVDLALGLVGQMALWLGVMKILEEAGMLRLIARVVKPVMIRLFPEVPAEHPAMGAMILNLAANMLGLTNAATPFGIKAMIELDKLNQKKGVATNAMALFLAINTSGVAVLPTGVVAIRASMGAKDPTSIFLPTLLATFCSTLTAVLVAKLLEKRRFFAAPEGPTEAGAILTKAPDLAGAEKVLNIEFKLHPVRAVLALLLLGVLGYGMFDQASQISGGAFEILKVISGDWILPMLLVLVLLVGFTAKVPVYEIVVRGAKEGFNVAILIIPFLVAILVAIGMFRASGGMDLLVSWVSPVTSLLGMPPEALPMALIRPLSGSGAMGVLMETMKTYGPDSFIGSMVSVMNGSTETTFYGVAVYYGAIGVRTLRHTVLACVAADVVGVMSAVFLSHLFFR